ncbi:Uu.00g107330.m01.CDS01 [Anthostomella pinea]|uniref:Uu.00g107330.m01.CDS01 n=1 Tax=Anthostomella pinea TaxID=933095 RepID=A0AAI8VF02_9PEZI|nr:Uu.00g107330.m01.CDS01 [Anthostomella pinea]
MHFRALFAIAVASATAVSAVAVPTGEPALDLVSRHDDTIDDGVCVAISNDEASDLESEIDDAQNHGIFHRSLPGRPVNQAPAENRGLVIMVDRVYHCEWVATLGNRRCRQRCKCDEQSHLAVNEQCKYRPSTGACDCGND